MALFLLQSGDQPLGQFDLLDGQTLLGGEVMTLDKVRLGDAYDASAFDVRDAYVDPGPGLVQWDRVVARLYTTTLHDTVPYQYNLYLSDEGANFYGVLFGTVVGSTSGLATGKGTNSNANPVPPTNLGPGTWVGSGKVTLWDKPGLYAVSLDAINAGVVPTSPFDSPLPGAALFADGSGKLCLAGASNASLKSVGTFVEVTNSGGLVQTPAILFAAGTPSASLFDRIVINYYGVAGSHA